MSAAPALTDPEAYAPEELPEREEKEERKDAATVLVELALELVDLVADDTGAPYAVMKDGPRVAIRMRGRDGLRQAMAREYFTRHDKAPKSQQLTDALGVLEGMAVEKERQNIPLRIASVDGVIYIDTGDLAGTVIAVSPTGWTTTTEAPVLFRRSALTGAMVTPKPGGDLTRLREVLNLDEKNFRLAIGWMLHVLIPDMPHAILAMMGLQGTGKTVGAKNIISILDPSPAPTKAPPKDPGQWHVQANASWVLGVDNLSRISDWMSDLWCRTVTGEGTAGRALYTDDDLSVTSYRRAIVLTSIDAGAMAGDLAERLLPLDLEPIPRAARRTDAAMQERMTEIAPDVLGGLLDLLVKVLAVLPTVHPEELPRMADFARVLAAVDQATGWTTVDDYAATGAEVAESVIDSDPWASAVRELARGKRWEGTVKALRDRIDPEKLPRNWPKSSQAATGALRRIIPALEQSGVTVTIMPRTMARPRLYILDGTESDSGGNSASSSSCTSFQSSDQEERHDVPESGHVMATSCTSSHDELPEAHDELMTSTSSASQGAHQGKQSPHDVHDAHDALFRPQSYPPCPVPECPGVVNREGLCSTGKHRTQEASA